MATGQDLKRMRRSRGYPSKPRPQTGHFHFTNLPLAFTNHVAKLSTDRAGKYIPPTVVGRTTKSHGKEHGGIIIIRKSRTAVTQSILVMSLSERRTKSPPTWVFRPNRHQTIDSVPYMGSRVGTWVVSTPRSISPLPEQVHPLSSSGSGDECSDSSSLCCYNRA